MYVCAAEPGMALLNQSFLLRGPLPDSTAYRSRYLCPLATRRWCDPPVLLSQHRLVSCSFTCSFFFSPPPLAPYSRLLVAITDSLDPPTLSLCVPLCCLPTAAYACLAHLPPGSGEWHLLATHAALLAYLGRYARRAHTMPGLMMGRKKSVAGRPCKARWDFHDHRGAGRRGRRVVFG